MAASDEEEDVVAAATGLLGSGSTSSGVQSVEWDGNFIGNAVNPSNTGFISLLSQGIEKFVNASMLGQTAKVLNKIAPSTESNMTNKERWMAGGAQGFFKNEDGSWNVTNPFKNDAIRKHKMVSILGDEYPMGPAVQVDDTTPFMLEHFSRPELNPEMVADRQRLYNLYLQYKDINPTLAQTYLDQYRNIESQYA